MCTVGIWKRICLIIGQHILKYFKWFAVWNEILLRNLPEFTIFVTYLLPVKRKFTIKNVIIYQFFFLEKKRTIVQKCCYFRNTFMIHTIWFISYFSNEWPKCGWLIDWPYLWMIIFIAQFSKHIKSAIWSWLLSNLIVF